MKNVYMILQQIYSGNFRQYRSSFIWDITKNILVSLFPGHSVDMNNKQAL